MSNSRLNMASLETVTIYGITVVSNVKPGSNTIHNSITMPMGLTPPAPKGRKAK